HGNPVAVVGQDRELPGKGLGDEPVDAGAAVQLNGNVEPRLHLVGVEVGSSGGVAAGGHLGSFPGFGGGRFPPCPVNTYCTTQTGGDKPLPTIKASRGRPARFPPQCSCCCSTHGCTPCTFRWPSRTARRPGAPHQREAAGRAPSGGTYRPQPSSPLGSAPAGPHGAWP